MRYPNYLNVKTLTIVLITGLIVGTFIFKFALADELKDFNEDFTNRAVAATGLVYVVLYSVWAKRETKKEEQEYRKNLEASLKMLEDSHKKNNK